ncbi:branched-chain amino acid aminotransferase [Puia dinghuensis]|uniref:Branched-chain-amino-acid aminotransferase n=1 Tax=Puia dinghuensis TaxID=1792502 RepID=A0A8J2UG88_9BACT|nr:branched-chain amino acid aminotransferase [Puia dinghuensis]GGB13209.1 branched chain amino acid aminotransferase [Puia dinghuensis]
MDTMMTPYIPVSRAYRSRLSEVDWDNLQPGAVATDHMLICDYAGGRWKDAEIVPFGPFSLSPTSLVFHYGQTIFEGMKAFRTEDDRVHIFRPGKHYQRLVKTAQRLCMPVVAPEIFREGLRRLVELEKDWVPAQPGGALYLRPFQIATDTRLSVRVSDSYRFAIVCAPWGAYFPGPVKVKVEREFTRAAKGGTGFAKCGGNYGGALYPTEQAMAEGYDQVLWTDGIHHKYVEESGMMNVFFVFGDKLVTPPLTDTILDGVTRDCLLTLAADAGISVEVRPVSVEELQHGLETGVVKEAFGAGTAAVVSPIGTIGIDGKDYYLPVEDGEGHGLSQLLKNALDDIRYGRRPDVHGWNYFVDTAI